MLNIRDKKGAAPTLVVFILLVLVSTSLVITYLQTTEERAIDTIQMSRASDTTRNRIANINADLEDALRKSATAAMYDAGEIGEDLDFVENLTITYMNNRIREGWDYPNVNIDIREIEEEDITFHQQPDGSLMVELRMQNTKVEHIYGPTAYGTFLLVDTYPRFRRLEELAHQVSKTIEDEEPNFQDLEDNLNDQYRYEGFEFTIFADGGVEVRDKYAGELVIV